MKSLKKWLHPSLLLASDCAVVFGSFWLAFQIRFHCETFLRFFPASKGTPPWELYQEALRAVVPLWIFVFAAWGKLYQSRFLEAANEFLSVAKSLLAAATLLFAATFLYREYEYSRLVMALASLLALFLLFLSREAWKFILVPFYGYLFEPETTVLIGEGKSFLTIKKMLERHPHKRILHYDKKTLQELGPALLKNIAAKEAYVAGKFLNDPVLEEALDDWEERSVEIKIIPELLEMRMGEVVVDESLRMPILHLKPLSLHGFRFLAKRFFDVALSICIVSLCFFPFLLLAFLILIDSRGGVFFVQERVGYQEKNFRCFKFRTMHRNAEQLLEKMNLPSFRGGPAFKMKDDPRVTRVGRWLRKFSLDEAAQIWNVLKGEMSLIGPRPQVLAEARGNPDWARRRYRVLPGITGLWQVSGRADLQYEDMMRLDIYYLENWSPGLDLKILLKTFPVVLSSRGAY